MSGYPKKRSAYIHFGTAQRKDRADEFKALSQTEIMQSIAAEWKKLSDGDKAPYNALAQKDKDDFAAYVAKHGPPPPRVNKKKKK